MLPTPTSKSSKSQNQVSTVRLPTLPQRPRFLRAMTSPIPILGAYATQTGNNNQSSWDPVVPGEGTDAQAIEDASPANNPHVHSKPGPQPLQANQLPAPSLSSWTPCEISVQSVSSSSALLPLAAATSGPGHCNSSSPISPSNHKSSIIDSLKRHWSKDQAFHWFLDSQHVEGVTPNPPR
jgi:hypothetical protein